MVWLLHRHHGVSVHSRERESVASYRGADLCTMIDDRMVITVFCSYRDSMLPDGKLGYSVAQPR